MMAKPKKRAAAKSVGDDTPKETSKIAYLVKDGSDEEIREALAGKIADFDKWPEREKAEAVRLTHKFWQREIPEALTLTDNKGFSPQGDPSLAILRLSDAFASSSEHLCNDRLAQLANYLGSTPSGSTDGNLSAAVAFVAGGGAQNTVQSSLLAQMAATHDAAMRALKRLAGAEYIETAQTFGNLSAKLLNVYTRQAETLAKLQRGAEQTVRHVYVDARTQTAYNYPPGEPEIEGQSHATEEFGGSAAMLGYDPRGHGVPISGGERAEAVPDARRDKPRGTEGK